MPLLVFYGDDFTGSTDCLEALTTAGVRARLYLDPPRPQDLPPGIEAVGVAGTSRSMTPAEMNAHLPPAFAALRALGAPLCHYKVCSTFDSSPAVGSIGRALELGKAAFAAEWAPLVVGAPVLGRFVAFSNLFARASAAAPRDIFRLDRHPTMRQHPVTPMHEADLRDALASQRTLSGGQADVNVLHLDAGPEAVAARVREAVAAGSDALVFDTLTEAHLATIGATLWGLRPPFAIGSSGVEYALVAAWRRLGLLRPAPVFTAPPVEQIVVASGSASAVTARQIAWAEANGFAVFALETTDSAQWNAALAAGRSAVLYTARGPESVTPGAGGRALGERLGAALAALLETHPALRRVVVCGGDTSGFVGSCLGIDALEMAAPMAPGSPLCRVTGGRRAGLEILFKGGQVGQDDLFGAVRKGTTG